MLQARLLPEPTDLTLAYLIAALIIVAIIFFAFVKRK